MTPNVLSRVLAFTGGASFTLDDQRPFSVVCADVPWPFKDSLPGASRGAEKNYDLLTIAEVAGFDFEGGDLLRHNVADDAILALWRVGAMVEEAYQVARAWGFVPKAEIVWCKRTKNGKRHFGMGRLVRGEHETAILATRGRYSQLIKAKNIRSTFDAKAPSDSKGRAIHSKKPEEFYDIMEKLAHGPYLELFARRRREGWTCVGKELR
jgi:N6-adenosine-specific RNA methylase IME4